MICLYISSNEFINNRSINKRITLFYGVYIFFCTFKDILRYLKFSALPSPLSGILYNKKYNINLTRKNNSLYEESKNNTFKINKYGQRENCHATQFVLTRFFHKIYICKIIISQ